MTSENNLFIKIARLNYTLSVYALGAENRYTAFMEKSVLQGNRINKSFQMYTVSC